MGVRKRTAVEEELRAVAEHVGDLAARLQPSGLVHTISDGGGRLLQIDPAELVGRPFSENLVHPDDRPSFEHFWARILDEGSAWVLVRMLRADGSFRWLGTKGFSHTLNDGLEMVLLVGHDITDRKLGIDELRESEARFREIADTVPVQLWMLGADMDVTFVNRAGLEFLGQPESPRETRELRERFIHEEDREELRKSLETAFISRQPFTCEARALDQSGHYRWMLMMGNPRYSSEGEFLGYAGASIDITPSKAAEEAMQRSERLASVGTLATGIAHEINNPLAVIRSAAEVALAARERTPETRAINHSLKRIITHVERATRITRDLLRFSRSESARRRHEDLNELVREVIQQVEKDVSAAQAELSCRLDPEAPFVLIRRSDVIHALWSVIRNAVESSTRPVGIEVRTERRGSYLFVIVSDDGDGISEDELARVFEPFYTTRRDKGASGLGLALVQRIVSDHGGTIEVESTLNGGSSFLLGFPVENG